MMANPIKLFRSKRQKELDYAWNEAKERAFGTARHAQGKDGVNALRLADLEIREADKDSLKSAIEQVRTAREALQSALLADPENTADIQAKATTLGNAESALTVQRALQEAKINEVLTPAQRTILDTSRKELQQRRRRGPRNQEQVPNQE